MDEAGNILIRRYSKSNVFIKSTATAAADETAIGTDILKLPNNSLDSDKIFKVSVFFLFSFQILYVLFLKNVSYIFCFIFGSFSSYLI